MPKRLLPMRTIGAMNIFGFNCGGFGRSSSSSLSSSSSIILFAFDFTISIVLPFSSFFSLLLLLPVVVVSFAVLLISLPLDFQKCADSDFDVFLMTKSSLSFAKLNIYIRALLLNHARSLSPSSFHKTKSKSLFVERTRVSVGGCER